MTEKIICIHQPSYFPWLGLLDKINKSDTFIYMDLVQLADRAFQHRNLFLTIQGVKKYLTVNTSKKDYRKKNINQLSLSNSNWSKEHLNFLRENYRKHPFFEEVFSKLETFYNVEYHLLNDVLHGSMILIFNILNIKTRIIKMSEMNYDKTKFKSELILELILKSNHSKYLSGQGAKDYMDIEKYNKFGVEVLFQEFKHPVYKQKGTDKFVPGISILDVLFNIGIKNTQKILHSL
tara:strand:- start:156 stop:860 length:705 start_codon:yes stop_codon:yes gene_type:complete